MNAIYTCENNVQTKEQTLLRNAAAKFGPTSKVQKLNDQKTSKKAAWTNKQNEKSSAAPMWISYSHKHPWSEKLANRKIGLCRTALMLPLSVQLFFKTQLKRSQQRLPKQIRNLTRLPSQKCKRDKTEEKSYIVKNNKTCALSPLWSLFLCWFDAVMPSEDV